MHVQSVGQRAKTLRQFAEEKAKLTSIAIVGVFAPLHAYNAEVQGDQSTEPPHCQFLVPRGRTNSREKLQYSENRDCVLQRSKAREYPRTAQASGWGRARGVTTTFD